MKNTTPPEIKIPLSQILRQYAYPITASILLLISAILSYILYANYKNKKRLFQLAYTDPLTGGNNFNKFKLDASKLLEKYSDSRFRLIKFDVDRFKVFNEVLGHEAGDNLLKNIIESMQLNSNDHFEVFARISADEFISIKKCENNDNLNNERENFENTLNQKTSVPFDHHLIYGRYISDIGEKNIEELYEKVNFAHKMAKARKIRFCDYDNSLKQELIRQKEIENQMEEALVNNEFIVYLQPKYLLSNEKIGGAEALVRWQRTNGEMIFPNNFIPIFEENGFITKLDMYMFDKVCALIHKWNKENLNEILVSVNFSRLHLGNENFISELCEISDKHNVPRRLLEIELTESTIFGNEETLLSVLEEIHQAGFTLSMDDFGTGYSSLGLLKNLPFDVLKLDRSFFITAQNNSRSLSILTHVINMAKELNIHTVAEGVEQIEHITLLKKIGCDMVQGYYYSKPIPISDFEELFKLQ